MRHTRGAPRRCRCRTSPQEQEDERRRRLDRHGAGRLVVGPLDGIRILEVGGIGPGPFAAMMLADNGAEVIRVQRPGTRLSRADVLGRSRRLMDLDLKTTDGVAALRKLAAEADGLIEGFRPGTMERLGIGPEVLLADNPRLVFGRITGWGQSGPLGQAV